MKHRTVSILVAALVATGAAAIHFWSKEQAAEAPFAGFEQVGREGPEAASWNVASGSAKISTNGSESSTRAAPSAFTSLPQSRVGLRFSSDPFGATSVAEQQWLDRNGYPNEKQWAAYKTASDGLVAQAAAAGDPLARIEADSRRLMKGDMSGQDGLMKAAVEGSQYALETLAAFHAGSGQGDRKSAYMLYRFGELRGNTTMAIVRNQLVDQLTPLQRREAEAGALQLFHQTSSHTRSRTGPRASVDPRPFGPQGKTG
jgi:hypothetical protein